MDVKTTFTQAYETVKKNRVSDKILKFMELERGNECVIGSGRCATHNVRTVRVMKNVKQRYECEDGSLKWRLCETAILECPRAFSGRLNSENIDATILPESEGSNGKTEYFSKQTNNQPERGSSLESGRHTDDWSSQFED